MQGKNQNRRLADLARIFMKASSYSGVQAEGCGHRLKAFGLQPIYLSGYQK
jgi:hypothetical protein